MTMARYTGVVTDEAGNIVPSATIEVRREIPGQPLAALKSNRAGTSAITNPFAAEADGTFSFHAAGGAYQIRAFTVSPAFEAPVRRYVPIGLAAESDGVDGVDAGVLFSWDTGTTDADPFAGNIRANNASMASATFLYVSKTSRGASDVENFLLALDDSTSTVKGTIVLSRPTDESQSTFNVTAVTDATDYVKVAVSNHSGATAFAAVDEISIQFYRAGDKGNTGAAGSNGSNGTNGTNGIDGASALTVVRVAATTNVTIASALENGDSLDGVTLATNDLVLLAGQSAPEENGVYVVAASGAASRASSFAAYNDHPGRYFSVMEGTAGADKLYRCTSDNGGTLGTTAIAISEFTSGGGRDRLLANRTYYVRTDGSDSNDGLSNTSGGAFLTIQKAIDTVAGLDISTYNVTIQVADGTYTTAMVINGAWVGSGTVTILGNTTTPANVVLNTTSSDLLRCINGGRITISGAELRTTTSGTCLHAISAGAITLGSAVRFGACATFHLWAELNGVISSTVSYSIVGAAGVHYAAITGGVIKVSGGTITVTGTPAFATAFAYVARASLLEVLSATFSGSATGTRYIVSENSVVFVNAAGATYFPGGTAGSTSTGGQYV